MLKSSHFNWYRRRPAFVLAHAILVVCMLATAVLMLTSCATVDATSSQYVGAAHQPPTDPSRVAILRSEPSLQYERLGEIVVDASIDPAPPITDVEAKLRGEAAKMGADAVVVVVDRIQPTGAYVSGPAWDSSIQTITGRKLIGIAIKYLR